MYKIFIPRAFFQARHIIGGCFFFLFYNCTYCSLIKLTIFAIMDILSFFPHNTKRDVIHISRADCALRWPIQMPNFCQECSIGFDDNRVINDILEFLS